ncbi:OprO/OprP family phosphate-selective porin [Pseudomonas aeruginosa]|uniref:OprO/OprP family phosphate-selective porin n=1 Tax=Pseudomonas aeruginosa TaxID=287 RepID=UPI000AC4135B|nr:OprO/OprP family phosphate-selective porin [Pseudomonas aeruginosa]RUE54076.1 porin [Pseudomonas aeruginosa]HEQ0195689.1 OprO/OprP family phosphate-selective porin [Pseudomonas aeruginosa]
MSLSLARRVRRLKNALSLILPAACLGTLAEAGAVELKLGGRLHLDYAAHRADTKPLDNGFLVRRAKLGVDGKLDDDWSFEVSYDFADPYQVTDDGSSKVGRFKDGFDDVALRYDGWKHADLSLGQFKVPFGLEELTSSNNITFVERALPTAAFAPSRRLGLGVGSNRERHTLSAMGFGSSIDGDDRGRGVAARATFTPIDSGAGGTLLHLGIAAVVERPRGEVKFNARPESRVSDVKLVNTGTLRNVERIERGGLEAAWRSGPVSLQAEWMRTAVERGHGTPDARLEGWYVMGSWLLTGESRQYRNGRFRGVPLQRSGGAWELAARYSRIDLDDGKVRGGEEGNLSLGLNFYANKRLRIMLDYIDVHSDRRGGSDNPNILLLRTQLAF